MSLFKILFSSNAKQWLSTIESQYDEEWGTIVKNFFIQDNISFEKYKSNMAWEGNKLSLHTNNDTLKACTITYRTHFAGNNKFILNNAELGYGYSWFYCAYPDVAKWCEDNYNDIKQALELQGVIYSPYFPENIQVLRFMVSMYQKNHKTLECQIQ